MKQGGSWSTGGAGAGAWRQAPSGAGGPRPSSGAGSRPSSSGPTVAPATSRHAAGQGQAGGGSSSTSTGYGTPRSGGSGSYGPSSGGRPGSAATRASSQGSQGSYRTGAQWESQATTSSSTAPPRRPAAAPPAAPATRDRVAFKVTTNSVKKDEIGIETLVGDYSERGENHGRKYFQKTQKIRGHEDIKVFLYYWDDRDGPEFSGWWFGNELGGSQVWARSNSHRELPPSAGWTIPWDAPRSEPGLLVVERVGGGAGASSGGPASSARPSGLPAPPGVPGRANSTGAAGRPGPGSAAQAAQRRAEDERRQQQAKEQAAAAAAAKREAEAKAKQKALEEKEAKEFKQGLPAAKTMIITSQEAVEVVVQMAAPILAEPPEEANEVMTKALEDVEAAAKDAQTKLADARKEINQRLQNARKYSSQDTRNSAVNEYSALQQKVNNSQKKLNPLKSFRTEIQNKITVRSALKEVAAKIESAEVEIEKVNMMVGAGDRQMSDDEVSSAFEALKPAKNALHSATQLIDRKLWEVGDAEKPKKDDIVKVKDRAQKTAERLSGILKNQKEGLSAAAGVVTATTKVAAAEAGVTACQDAEMPFLKGIEILPPDESREAIGACEASAAKAETIVGQARGSLKSKIGECKGFSKEVAARTMEELKSLEKRLDASAKKLAAFKKETAERKTAAMLAEAHEAVSEAETGVTDLAKACDAMVPGGLESTTAEALQAGVEAAVAAEKVAVAAVNKARKVLTSKQKESRSSDGAAALKKLQDRMTTAHNDLSKQRMVSSSGDRLVKGKTALADNSEKVQQIEEDIVKGEKVAEAGDKSSDDEVEAMGTSMEAAKKSLTDRMKAIDALLPGAPPALKTSLHSFTDRCKTLKERVDKLLAATKERREKVMGESMVKEATGKTAEVDAALAKVDEAELPFLKGVEVLPLKETTAMVDESETLAKDAHASIAAARNFIAAKHMELKSFAEAAAKSVKEELVKLSERINAQSNKLSQFKKDTEVRKLNSQMQATGDMVSTAEGKVKEAAEALEPFAPKEGEEPAELSGEICEQLIQKLKAAGAAIDGARGAVASRRKEAKGNTVHNETLDKLANRLKESAVELAKHKKAGSKHEQRYVSKRLIQEATKQVEDAEAALEVRTKGCAPLLEQKGLKFLIATSVETLATALHDHMKEKSFCVEALFKDINASSGGNLTKESFVSYLEGLPQALGREELAFSAERRGEIFDHIDSAAVGTVTLESFKNVFSSYYLCVKGLAVTDKFEIKDSKTVVKIDPGTVLEGIGCPQKDESTGMTRLECKVVSSGKVGFATTEGNQGTKYVEQVSPFRTFCDEMDKSLTESLKAAAKVSHTIGLKLKDIEKTAKEGPLLDAKAELTKLKPRISQVQSSVEALRKKAAVEKRKYKEVEDAEKNAYIVAREKKQAAALTSPASDKVQAMEEKAKLVQEAGKSLLDLSDTDLLKFSSPLTVREAVEAASKEALESHKSAKECLSEQQALLPKGDLKGPMLTAKKEFGVLAGKLEGARKVAAATVAKVRQACKKVVDLAKAEVAAALRSKMSAASQSLEQLFVQLAAGAEKISDEAFSNFVADCPGHSMQKEQIKLLAHHLESGGISRRGFIRFLQQYFEVAKPIAITTAFEISSGKSVRKAEIGELLEVLEGPRTDEKLGMARVRARSLLDNLEGWVAVKGNQGTPFLKEIPKPHHICQGEVLMSKAFDGGDDVRKLQADEVLELLEGPKKETFAPAQRLRVKAASDDAGGWVTSVDKRGVEHVASDGKTYHCTAVIAMTDNSDIKNCKVLRKLAVGELFVAVEGPVEFEEAGMSRVKGKALKDDVVGWITMKGNAGTLYAEVSKKHYSILKEVPLHKTKASSSEQVRVLKETEAVEVLEGPKPEIFQAETRVKCRALSDGAEGWVTSDDKLKRWLSRYTCKQAAPLEDSSDPSSASTVRELEVGEKLDFMEGPVFHGDVVRIKVSAMKDNSTGWATVRGKDGKPALQC